MMATVGCSRMSKPLQVGFEQVEFETRDSVAYDGYCIRGTTSDYLHMITSNGDTLKLDVTKARKDGNIFGQLEPGDEMYVMMTSDTAEVQMVVNKTALLGKWVQPDPIDGSSDIGIEIKIGGDAKSYSYPEGTNYVDYISWRVHNGKMLIEESRDDGVGDSEFRSYKIIKVTPDSLILRADDDEEAPYDFGRWKPNHEYDDLPKGLEIDDGSSDAIAW